MNVIKAIAVDELADGEMKAVKVDEKQDILVCRLEGQFFALGAKCTHYGAPLEKGVLSRGRIICPWHHACFDARSGQLGEPPALDALPVYPVKVEDGHVIVTLPDELESSRLPAMTLQDKLADERTFVIVGAGAAGNAAAQALREVGFQGEIKLITQESHAPYDRPNLSKDYLQGTAKEDWLALRPCSFYEDHGIDLILEQKVSRIDLVARQVIVDSGEPFPYAKLLLATGGEPRRFEAPGADLAGVFYLRSRQDAETLIQAAEQARAIAVIGAGFIGMEAAYSLKKRTGKPVTVIAPHPVPFMQIFGEAVGRLFQTQQEQHGVTFRLGSKVVALEGDHQVTAVRLESGERIEADLVLVGIGVKPATDFIDGLNKREDGGILVDEYFQAGQDVYAAGDIAVFPDAHGDRPLRIEHWRTAEQQGRIAAHHMAGITTPDTSIPFFWTAQAGLNLGYVGHASSWDEIITWGRLEDREFLVFYIKDGQLCAVAGNNRNRELAALQHLMEQRRLPTVAAFRDESLDLVALAQGG